MKDKNKEILKQELFGAYLNLIVCLVFSAVGIGLIFAGLSGEAFYHISSAIFISVFIAAFLGFSIFLFIQCLKKLVPYYQSLKALKYGQESTATICGHTCHSIKHHGSSDLWGYHNYYSIHLRFFDDNGKEIIFKTGCIYNQEQFNQLSKLPEITIKKYKNTAVIIEELIDPLDYKFSELPKKLRINTILVVALAWFSLALIISGFVWLCVLDYNDIKGLNNWALGILISGIVLIIVSATLKSFIYYKTKKFVENEPQNIRRAERKSKIEKAGKKKKETEKSNTYKKD